MNIMLVSIMSESPVTPWSLVGFARGIYFPFGASVRFLGASGWNITWSVGMMVNTPEVQRKERQVSEQTTDGEILPTE